MTVQEKLNALRKAWGYIEVSEATVVVSGWKVWLAKNYRGKPIREIPQNGLPGNPRATVRIEYTGSTPEKAIKSAYRSMVSRAQRSERKKNAA